MIKMRLPALTTSNVNTSTTYYPRTGKRGVPQQFPRKLFEMLESESKTLTHVSDDDSTTDVPHPDSKQDNIIEWSESGRAFRIVDVASFSNLVLSKYFRTSNFSSFQRNLNLFGSLLHLLLQYGFSKVRRGPDADMYAHPNFIRGRPDLLSTLRKCKTAADRKRLAKDISQRNFDCVAPLNSYERVVSPCHPQMQQARLDVVSEDNARQHKRIIDVPKKNPRLETQGLAANCGANAVQQLHQLTDIRSGNLSQRTISVEGKETPDNKLNLLAMVLISMAGS